MLNQYQENAFELWQIAENGETRRLKEVLDTDTDIDAANSEGVTALMRAAAHGRTEMVEALIGRGADINATRADGFTALALAAFFGHAEVVRILVEHGADLSAATRFGTSADMWASARSFRHVAQYLGQQRNSGDQSEELPIPVEAETDNSTAELEQSAGGEPQVDETEITAERPRPTLGQIVAAQYAAAGRRIESSLAESTAAHESDQSGDTLADRSEQAPQATPVESIWSAPDLVQELNESPDTPNPVPAYVELATLDSAWAAPDLVEELNDRSNQLPEPAQVPEEPALQDASAIDGPTELSDVPEEVALSATDEEPQEPVVPRPRVVHQLKEPPEIWELVPVHTDQAQPLEPAPADMHAVDEPAHLPLMMDQLPVTAGKLTAYQSGVPIGHAIRELKEPPDIWDQVPERPADFHPAVAFLARITANDRKLALLTLTIMVTCAVATFAFLKLRQETIATHALVQPQSEHVLPVSATSPPVAAAPIVPVQSTPPPTESVASVRKNESVVAKPEKETKKQDTLAAIPDNETRKGDSAIAKGEKIANVRPLVKANTATPKKAAIATYKPSTSATDSKNKSASTIQVRTTSATSKPIVPVTPSDGSTRPRLVNPRAANLRESSAKSNDSSSHSASSRIVNSTPKTSSGTKPKVIPWP